MHWYAVSTWAQNALDANAEMIGLGVQTYVPCETVERRLGRTMRTTRRPVWPGYLFVRCEREDFPAILAIEGVHDFIRDYDKREPVSLVSDALVPVVLAELFGDLDYTRKPATWTPERGDKVKIRSGKWKGYLGSILSLSKRKAIIETQWCKMEVTHEELEAA